MTAIKTMRNMSKTEAEYRLVALDAIQEGNRYSEPVPDLEKVTGIYYNALNYYYNEISDDNKLMVEEYIKSTLAKIENSALRDTVEDLLFE